MHNTLMMYLFLVSSENRSNCTQERLKPYRKCQLILSLTFLRVAQVNQEVLIMAIQKVSIRTNIKNQAGWYKNIVFIYQPGCCCL